jgi:hypothetical protein
MLVGFLVLTLPLEETSYGFSQENTYTIGVYDYNTGALLSEIMYWELPYEEVSEDHPFPILLHEWDGGTKFINCVTNSRIMRVDLDTTNRRVFVQIEGENGTKGRFVLFVSETFVASPAEINVLLDNESIDFTAGTTALFHAPSYFIKVEYTHSLRRLLFDLGRGPTPEAVHVPSLGLLLIGVVVAALGALYWFKLRR